MRIDFLFFWVLLFFWLDPKEPKDQGYHYESYKFARVEKLKSRKLASLRHRDFYTLLSEFA